MRMHRMMLLCVAGIACLGSAAYAAPRDRDCSAAGLRRARDKADKAMHAHDPDTAIAILEPLSECLDDGDVDSHAWVDSDLAEAYARQGRYSECANLMMPLEWRTAKLSSERLVNAVRHNVERCINALDRRYRQIRSDGCQIEVDDAIATAPAPAALVPRGATAACVALLGGAPVVHRSTAENASAGCRRIELVWSADHVEHRELVVEGGPLFEPDRCCRLDTIAAGTKDGQALVRIQGSGHPCGGYMTHHEIDVLYRWNGQALTPSVDMSTAFLER